MALNAAYVPQVVFPRFIDAADGGMDGGDDGGGGGGGGPDARVGLLGTDLGGTSLTGSGLLEGYSGYRPDGNTQLAADPTAPWNAGPIRKWKTKTFSGTLTYLQYNYAGDLICFQAPSFPLPGAGSASYAFSGVTSLWPASNGTETLTTYGGPGRPWYNTCELQVEPSVALNDIQPLTTSNDVTVSRTLTVRTLTGKGQVFVGGAVVEFNVTTGTATVVLGSPDTEYLALLRAGGAVPGTLDYSEATSYATTVPEFANDIAFTGTSARRTIQFTGLTPGNTYTVTATLRLEPTGPGAQRTEVVTTTFTAAAATDTCPLDIPMFDGFRAYLAGAIRSP